MFYVGQKVVCVDAANEPGARWRPGEAPTKGGVYTVTGVRAARKGRGQMLRFAELARCDELQAIAQAKWGTWPGYVAKRFRPVVERKTDISIFTDMLNPSDERVTA